LRQCEGERSASFGHVHEVHGQNELIRLQLTVLVHVR